ncbi:Cytokine receptor common subunit beta [Galemys pyrenaicus]|uniref:Cytokine receptor common subunit beta n=1 Tax=Galemys pyrenaicus TaxID=202257 RepID=A0A8J5ZZM9_GALPY|nr:Cytokine receptor common subunit beta [Galemys pyrenaicus]
MGERRDPSFCLGSGTTPLRTLQCHNDYTSHITCRWGDTPEAQQLLNLTLHRRLNKDPPQPVSCDLSEDKSWLDSLCPDCVPRRCVIPYNLFVLADEDYFFFRPARLLGAQISVRLAQHACARAISTQLCTCERSAFNLVVAAQGSTGGGLGHVPRLPPSRPAPQAFPPPPAPPVQPPAPKDLQVRASGDQVLLSWSLALEPSRRHWLSALDFEVVYRRLQDSWEDAATAYSNCTQARLGPELLLPRSTYVARVRARLGPDSGLSGRPSQWSPEVHWESPPGDEAQPRNLQCLFNGVDVLSCSWQVRAEVAGSVAFSLFYTSSGGAEEKECAPAQKGEQGSPYVLQWCQIPVPDPAAHSQYSVSVRPRREEKHIKSSDNIQLARPSINVTRGADGYMLHWAAEKMLYDHIGHTFQVQYRKDADSWEVTKADLLQNAHSMSLPRLESSTRYRARVRVKPTPGGYNGIWSEWSEECVWDTEWALPAWVLPLLLVPVTLALLTALRFGGTYCYRLTKKWEEKIPNPSKSHLFQNGSLGLPNSVRALSSGYPPLKGGPWDSPILEPQGVFPVDFGRGEVSELTTQDPKDAAEEGPCEPATRAAASAPPMEPPPSPLEGQASGFDFNGPYLGAPHSRSLPDVAGTPRPPRSALSQGPQPPGSLEYMCLPPGGQVQLVPLAQVMGQGRTPHVDSRPCPGTEGSPVLPSGKDTPPAAPGSRTGAEGPKDSPPAVSTAPGRPEDSVRASGYVTAADLTLSPPVGPWSTSQSPPLDLPSELHPGPCSGLASAPPGGQAPLKPELEGYVELPLASGQLPTSPRVGVTPPAASSPVLSPGHPPADVTPMSPHSEGLLVLQQVGDYCFLPGLAHSPVSPQGKPSSPGPCPEVQDQLFQNKKPWCPDSPQLPAIQLFKALKQQDYLSLPPWDVSRSGEVC